MEMRSFTEEHQTRDHYRVPEKDSDQKTETQPHTLHPIEPLLDYLRMISQSRDLDLQSIRLHGRTLLSKADHPSPVFIVFSLSQFASVQKKIIESFSDSPFLVRETKQIDGALRIRVIENESKTPYEMIFHFSAHQNSLDHPRLNLDSFTYDLNSGRWITDVPEYKEDLNRNTLRIHRQKDESALDRAASLTREELLIVAWCASELDYNLDSTSREILKETFHLNQQNRPTRDFYQSLLIRIVTARKPSQAFRLLLESGELEAFLPELASGYKATQNRFHKYDIFFHNIYTCDAVEPPDPVLRLAGLFHDIGKVETRKEKPGGDVSFHNHEVISAKQTTRILRRLGFPKAFTRRVVFLVRNHMFHYTDEWSDRAIRRFMKKVEPGELEELIQLRLADRKGSGKRQSLPGAIRKLIEHMKEVSRKEKELKIKDLPISGHDLMDLGMTPGPNMGKVLQELLELVVDQKIEMDRTQLLNEARRRIKET